MHYTQILLSLIGLFALTVISSPTDYYSSPNSGVPEYKATADPEGLVVTPFNPTTDIPTDDLYRDEIQCDTSEASPTRTEIDGLVTILHDFEHWCSNDNQFGSRCTKVASYKGGSVSLCGAFKTMSCDTVADRVRDIQKKCEQKKWKAGGRYYLYSAFYIALH